LRAARPPILRGAARGVLKQLPKLSADLFVYHDEKYADQSYEVIAARCSAAFYHYISSDASGTSRSFTFLLQLRGT
jgi:hypothetical protein